MGYWRAGMSLSTLSCVSDKQQQPSGYVTGHMKAIGLDLKLAIVNPLPFVAETTARLIHIIKEKTSSTSLCKGLRKISEIIFPHFLECKVKWALRSITRNKGSGGDGIPVELFQILKDRCRESAALNMSANWENTAVATGLEKVSFLSNPKEGQCQKMFKLLHNCTHLTR